MKIFLRLAIIGTMCALSTGCGKDPAKIQEAKSLAICDCETAECVTSEVKRFKPNEEAVKGVALDQEQKERIAIAQERLNRCVEKLGASL